MGCVSAHVEQLGQTLLTDDGLYYFIDLQEAHDRFEYTCTPADADDEGLNSRLQGAVNAFLFPAALYLLDTPYGTTRAAQLDEDLRLVRNDVQGYLHARRFAAPRGPPSSAQTASQQLAHPPPAQAAAFASLDPGSSTTRDDELQTRRSGSPVDLDDAMSDPDSPPPPTPVDGWLGSSSFAPFPVDDDMSLCLHETPVLSVDRDAVEAARAILDGLTTFVRFYVRAKQNLDFRTAARENHHLEFRGNCGPIARPFPDVDMLHEVVPDVVSLAIDIPVSATRDLAAHPRPFPYLTRLTIDETNVSLWTHNDMERTVSAFHAYDIPELYFVNARRATVRVCSEFVAAAHTCVLIDDDITRCVSFIDQRNFERYVYGTFVNGVSCMYNTWFWSSITTLTLCEAMTETELPLLFGCFPKGLQHLRIWFAGGRVPKLHEAELLHYRGAGCGCCAQLSSMTLTSIWPFKGRRGPSQTRRIPVDLYVVRAFLRHLHDGEKNVDIKAEGSVEFV